MQSNLTYIDLGTCLDKIYQDNNLNDNENILVTKYDLLTRTHKSNDNNNNNNNQGAGNKPGLIKVMLKIIIIIKEQETAQVMEMGMEIMQVMELEQTLIQDKLILIIII